MSGSSVVVLAPNGRRQTVKCTPNTTILQIIEEVCKKQGFNPIEYDIKHHNKILDTTTAFRFSGLPNNAQLELADAIKNRCEKDITLAVNLENGTRITDTFSPNDTLLNVLNKICPENALPERNPVVVYTRREIFGKELENCTLRSLGLMGGRAMIRVLNKDPELLKQQANVSAPLPTKPVEEKPYLRKFQPLEEKTEEPQPATEHNFGPGNRLDSSDIKPEKNVKNTTKDILKLAKEKRKSQSEEEKLQKGKKPMVQEKSPKKVERMDIKEAPQKSIEEEFIFCGDRNGMIFSLESANSVPTEDLPDDFFELTIDDARKILRDVKRKRHELENQALRTSHLRNLEESKKQLRQLNKYKRAIIRVQFPDRTVIQGTFKPTETVGDIVNFIRTYLDDESLDFYLYTAPPKSVLSNDSRLIEVGCVPGALIYFGSPRELREGGKGFLKSQFQSMFTSNSVASLAAARIRKQNTRNVAESDDPDDDVIMTDDTNDSYPVNYGASTSSDNGGATERKVVTNTTEYPKWFKPH
ncbi:tether containing UBX domain for GLUT4 isoform X2 [Anthonomus grandis grandis]|uniref:tether containing UBX domain for GLUT4 isoform X2 n=1 Tax=Anthonomus grandis grandis TaxID=2921223 RepID=UPI0021655632|nr:tether containing UBX domain for GLUT4 isoform X2 [Anthonomus grandis grandis]